MSFDFLIKENLNRFLRIFERFLVRYNYDLKLIWIHTGLIYLNISGVHEAPYSDFIFLFGKYVLEFAVAGEWPY